MKVPTAFPDVARVGGDVTAPRIVREAKPQYTPEAMREKIAGTVMMEVLVLASGEVGGVEVVESLDREFGLDEEAKKAAWQWVFTPGTRDGIAVPVVVTLEMTFTLRK
jgi:protein TonB